MKFSELNLNKQLFDGITEAGFTDCMPVQTMTLEQTLQGKDVLVQSQTGSGKTIAFLISIMENMINDDTQDKKALIIVPTRELAVQIENEAKLLNKYCNLLIGCFYGGVGYDKQQHLLKNNVRIIIGTPGRLIDFSKSKKLNFRDFNQLIIDEADRLFDMGFYEDIKYMLSKMIQKDKRHTMLFSATLSDRAKWIAGKFMNDPVEITINRENITVEKISQELYHVGKDEKFSLLLGILKKEQYENVLIFTNTKRAAEKIAFKLNQNGINAQFIIGDLPQKKRIKILDEMKAGKIKLLIATNVAARGIHIDDLDLVINYDIPEEYEDYVHRIGRTARAGKEGKAITLACEEYVYGLERIEEYINMKIPITPIDDELIIEDKSGAFRSSYNRKGNSSVNKKANRSKRTTSSQKLPKRNNTVSAKKQQTVNQEKTQKKRNNNQEKNQFKKNKTTTQQKTTNKKNTTSSNHKKRKKSADSRLEYYKEKYGENFTVKNESSTPKKKTIFQKVKSLLGKK